MTRSTVALIHTAGTRLPYMYIERPRHGTNCSIHALSVVYIVKFLLQPTVILAYSLSTVPSTLVFSSCSFLLAQSYSLAPVLGI